MLVNTYFENKVDQLFEVADRLARALSHAGIEYRVIGGFAAYMHVNAIEPMAARLTRDIDVAVDRKDLDAIAEGPQRRSSGVHRRKSSQRVYRARTRFFSACAVRTRDFHNAVVDLVKMKLTSFRLKDRVHIQDLDAVGSITPEIEDQLSGALKSRLLEVRATE